MQPDTTPKLLLSAREAARALSISERTLWGLSAPRGPIPIVRIGLKGVRYSLRALQQFAEGRDNGKVASNGQAAELAP